MAQQKPDGRFMSPDLAMAPAPASADYSLLVQAGRSAGAAAEVSGKTMATTLVGATKLGEQVYEGYVQNQATTAATNVASNLFTSDYIGQEAQRTIQAETSQLAQELSDAGGDRSVVKDYEERAKRIAEAVSAKTFTQDQAITRLTSDMRQLIAAHPGQAQNIRKVFNEITGRGDWDVRPIEAALTAKAKEDEFKKAQLRLLESDAKKIFESGVGSQFGMKSSAEVFANIVQGTDAGVRMGTIIQAQNLIENSNKVKTSGNMNEFYNATIVGAGAARAQTAQRVFATLEQRGININTMVSPTEAQREAITDAYRQMKTAERNSLLAAETDLRNRILSNPTMDRTVVDDTMKRIEERLKNTPLTTDLDSMLSELKANYTAANTRADTVLKAAQVTDLTLRTTWGDDLISKMKDPRTRKQMVADYPNNPAVQELAAMFEGRQTSFSARMQQMALIADGMFGIAARPEAVAAAAAADTTPEGRASKAAVIQLQSAKGVEVLTAKGPATPLGASAVTMLAGNFTPNEASWNTLYQSVMDNTVKTVLPNEVDFETFNQNIVKRTDFWLGPNNPNSYSIKWRETLKNLPGVTIEANREGLLIITGKTPTTSQEIGQMSTLQSDVVKANQLIRVYNKLTNTTTKAKQTVDDLYQGTPAPVAGVRPAQVFNQTPVQPIRGATPATTQPVNVAEELRQFRLRQGVQPAAPTPQPTPATQPPTSSLTKEQFDAYNKQKTVKGKVQVLLDAGVDRSTIEQLVRRPIDAILAGEAD